MKKVALLGALNCNGQKGRGESTFFQIKFSAEFLNQLMHNEIIIANNQNIINIDEKIDGRFSCFVRKKEGISRTECETMVFKVVREGRVPLSWSLFVTIDSFTKETD